MRGRFSANTLWGVGSPGCLPIRSGRRLCTTYYRAVERFGFDKKPALAMAAIHQSALDGRKGSGMSQEQTRELSANFHTIPAPHWKTTGSSNPAAGRWFSKSIMAVLAGKLDVWIKKTKVLQRQHPSQRNADPALLVDAQKKLQEAMQTLSKLEK